MLKALDLFCGAGGATRGLQTAGFHVTGVDMRPQPHYCGDEFVQGDALTFPLDGYHVIWASPPCQFGSEATPETHRHLHPNLIPATRERLQASGTPYIIENVEGSRAHLINPIMLCGSMFGLRVWRHRYFETSFPIVLAPATCNHSERPVLVTGQSNSYDATGRRSATSPIAEKREAIGIDWMTCDEITEAIPPAYSHWLATHALRYIYEEATP